MLESGRPIQFEAIGHCRWWAVTRTERPNRLARSGLFVFLRIPRTHLPSRCAPAPPWRGASWPRRRARTATACSTMTLSTSLGRPPAFIALHRHSSRQHELGCGEVWSSLLSTTVASRSRLRRWHPVMQTISNMVIPPRRGDSPSSGDSPNSADSSSSGDDAGGEDAVARRRPPRVAVRKVSMRKPMRKRGQPSSSRGNPSNIGVKQSPLKKFRKLQCGVRQSPLEKDCELQGMSAM
jgi:hypothetical protein